MEQRKTINRSPSRTDQILKGKVVATVEGARFIPDSFPNARLRLTTIAMDQPVSPQDVELDLLQYVDKNIQYEYEQIFANWVWRVRHVQIVP